MDRPQRKRSKRVFVGVNDVASQFPEIAKEAVGWDPTEFAHGSHEKMLWKCKLDHEWLAQIKARTASNSGCPYCAGKKLLKGFNDMKTLFPTLSTEAYGWNPEEVLAGTHALLKWKCINGHIWERKANGRTVSGNGCPICANRKRQTGVNDLLTTHPEIAKEADGWDPGASNYQGYGLKNWKCEKGHKWKANLGSRKSGFGSCPYCSNLKLLSGFNDLKTLFPEIASEAIGWDPTNELPNNPKKLAWKCPAGHIYKQSIQVRTKTNAKCVVCGNREVLPGFNDLASQFPLIASEADGWDPSTVTAGTHQRKSWKCQKGHSYIATVVSRTGNGTGCAVCTNKKVLVGFNDLATVNPDLAKEANGWDPRTVTVSSGKRVSWRCAEGHVWETTPSVRKKGVGCASCAKTGFDPNSDSWIYLMENTSSEMLMIGISNVPNERTKRHAKKGWELIDLRGPMEGFLARSWETSMLQFLASSKVVFGKAKDSNLIQEASEENGQVESWLKTSLNVRSLKELMSLVEEWEK
jgi:hypothetical protein